MSHWLLGLLDRIDPEVRRLWAVRLLVGSVVLNVVNTAAWGFGIVGHEILDLVTNQLSWLALSLTLLDVVATTDVRANTEEG